VQIARPADPFPRSQNPFRKGYDHACHPERFDGTGQAQKTSVVNVNITPRGVSARIQLLAFVKASTLMKVGSSITA
jgi:hypothetical protein